MTISHAARRSVVLCVLSALAAGCDPGPDFDEAFFVDPWQDGRRVSTPPGAFAHAGTWTGVCRMEDREPFQVELQLDGEGNGGLVRHDMAPSELAAAGRSDDEGLSVVEAVLDDIVFRVDMSADDDVVRGACFDLYPTEEDGDGMLCMFPSIGCPSTPTRYEIAAQGELVLVKTS